MTDQLKKRIEENLIKNKAKTLFTWVIGMYEMFEKAGATKEFLREYLECVMSEENIKACVDTQAKRGFSTLYTGPYNDKHIHLFEYIQGLCEEYGVEYAIKAWEYAKDFVQSEKQRCAEDNEQCGANYFDGVIRYVVQTNPHDVYFEVSNGTIGYGKVGMGRLCIAGFPLTQELKINDSNHENYMEFEMVMVRSNLHGIRLGKKLVLETIKAIHESVPDAGIMASCIHGDNKAAYYTYASLGGQLRYDGQDYTPQQLDEIQLERLQTLEVFYENEKLDEICGKTVEIKSIDSKYLCEAQKREIEQDATM